MALELKDLSTYRLIQGLKSSNKPFDRRLADYLEKARVLNYSDLYDYTYGRTLNNHSLEKDCGLTMAYYTIYIAFLQKKLDLANAFLKKRNSRKRKNDIILFPDSNEGIPLIDRTNTDWQNKVIRLDCFDPLNKDEEGLKYSNFNAYIEEMICGLSIAELRTLLSTLDTSDGRCALESNFKGIGSSKKERYSDAILRYDEQLDRLFNEMKMAEDSCENIFDYKRCDRESIVFGHLQEIYIYLLSRTRDFTFGTVSDSKYEKIMTLTDPKYRGKNGTPLLSLICDCLTHTELIKFSDSRGLDIHDGIGPVLVKRLTK